jgi:hypothetical protein
MNTTFKLKSLLFLLFILSPTIDFASETTEMESQRLDQTEETGQDQEQSSSLGMGAMGATVGTIVGSLLPKSQTTQDTSKTHHSEDSVLSNAKDLKSEQEIKENLHKIKLQESEISKLNTDLRNKEQKVKEKDSTIVQQGHEITELKKKVEDLSKKKDDDFLVKEFQAIEEAVIKDFQNDVNVFKDATKDFFATTNSKRQSTTASEDENFFEQESILDVEETLIVGTDKNGNITTMIIEEIVPAKHHTKQDNKTKDVIASLSDKIDESLLEIE